MKQSKQRTHHLIYCICQPKILGSHEVVQLRIGEARKKCSVSLKHFLISTTHNLFAHPWLELRAFFPLQSLSFSLAVSLSLSLSLSSATLSAAFSPLSRDSSSRYPWYVRRRRAWMRWDWTTARTWATRGKRKTRANRRPRCGDQRLRNNIEHISGI